MRFLHRITALSMRRPPPAPIDPVSDIPVGRDDNQRTQLAYQFIKQLVGNQIHCLHPVVVGRNMALELAVDQKLIIIK